MKYLLLGITAALALTLALAAPASAQVPRTMSYQGILTDNLGSPIADGNYSLTVRLYDAAGGGALLYTEVHPVVAVARGGFNVILGSVTPLSIAFDQPLWLSLQVGVDPELSPRVPLASSAYALGLSLPFDGRNDGNLVPTFMLRNATASGSALETEGAVTINGPTGIPSAVIKQFSAGGGQISVRDELNSPAGRMEIDANGTGGYFSIYRSASSLGFTIDGNDGTEEPIVTVSGSARSAKFDMSVSGDASVALPTSSVNSVEEFNEPGVAEVYANSSLTVGNGITTMVSRTITVPDDGYVIAMGMGHAEIDHVAGQDARILYGVNDVSGAFASSQGVAGVSSSTSTGLYRFPTPFTGVWPVTAGAHTFYLLAQKINVGMGINLNDPTLTLLYVPTAYGTVTGNKAFAGGDVQTSNAPVTSSEIENEKSAAAAFDQARIQRELDVMKAQLDALTSRMANDPNTAPPAPQK